MEATQKLKNLRHRLDQLGYKEVLAIESLPLVERLFLDLVKTIENLRKTKAEQGKKDNPEEDASNVEYYKNDNAKLVKENLALNQKLIKQKEEHDVLLNELKCSMRNSGHTLADLKFLNNQYMQKIKSYEKESKEKSDRIQQLQEKNFHAIVQTPGGRKKNIPFRRQRMEIDYLVPPKEPDRLPVTENPDPYIADLLETADKRVAEMEGFLKEMTEKNEVNDMKLENFRQQVSTRDEEIDRLSKMLSGGRPSDTLALEVKNRANEKMISHLNIQVDILQQQNRSMQQRLQECVMKKEELQDDVIKLNLKNADLECQVKSVDRKAKLLQSDKDFVVHTADTEMNVAKNELYKSHQHLEEMDNTVSRLKSEKEDLLQELKELKDKVTRFKRLESLLDKVQEEKRRLTHKVNKLMANEKELVLENERLKHRGVTKKGKIPTKIDTLIKTLEEDRNYYRDQSASLQKLIQGDPMPRSISPTKNMPERKPRTSRSTSPVKELTSLPDKLNKKTISHYERICQLLEQERDYFKTEYQKLKALKRSSSPVHVPSNKNQYTSEFEFQKVCDERDKMKEMLEKFERHMNEVRANVKVLTKERDNLSDLYEESKAELQKVRREMVRSPKSPKTSLAAQAILSQVENERDDATAELQRVTTERDSLRERLKLSTETSLSERAHFEQKVEDLDSQLKMATVERNELQMRVKNLKDDINNLEERIKTQALQVQEAREDASKQRMTSTQMRLLAEEAERSMTEMQRRLNAREEDILSANQKTSHLEEKVQEVQKISNQNSNEVHQLRSTITAMDREKDSLQMTIDDKTEQLAALNEEIRNKERIFSDLKAQVSQLEAQLDHVNSNLTLKEREIKSVKRQLDSATEDLSEASRAKEMALRENKHLQEDLTVMTSENQNLNHDLQEALEEKEILKKQVQSYILEIQRVEDLLAAKEQERTDLLDQYRTLSAEAEHYQNSNHQLESEGSNLRLEILTRESEIRMLKEKTDRMDRELQEHLGAQQAYELQVSNLTRTLSNLEENLQQCEDDKKTLSHDISSVRDLCCRLEASKESLQRQLNAISVEKEQLLVQINDMKQETDTIRSQLTSERSAMKNLEDLLQNNREKEFHSQLEAQEKTAELKQLKDRLTLNESKLQSQSRDIASLRTRNVELEGDLERVRRQLTSEKFERERAVQELRRRGIVPPITGDYSIPYARSASPATRYISPNTSVNRYSPDVSKSNGVPLKDGHRSV